MADTVRILNNDEAAALIGIAPATLRFWRWKGRGPCFVKLGEARQAGVAYVEEDVLAWREARKFASTTAATVKHPGNA